MDYFLMICYVAADFNSPGGDVFSIRPKQIGTFVEAPTWVKDTLMFKWLVKDGSIKVAEETITKTQGENDPMKGIAASGKDEKVAENVEVKVVEAVTKKPRAKKTKKDDAE